MIYLASWGPKLYQDDVTQDVRDEYKDQLKRGLTNEQVTKKIIEENKDYIEDYDDAPLFWFALADTQWKLGRLLPFVKEKALEYLELGKDLEKWQDEGKKNYETRKKVLQDLKTQLLSQMPTEKKISQYRLYKCEWQVGDVFAYKFHSDLSKEHNLYNKYILFRKVGEASCWPGHISPVVHVYRYIDYELPGVNIVPTLECIPSFIWENPRDYELQIDTESKKKYQRSI